MENASLQPSGVNETPADNLGHQRDLLGFTLTALKDMFGVDKN